MQEGEVFKAVVWQKHILYMKPTLVSPIFDCTPYNPCKYNLYIGIYIIYFWFSFKLLSKHNIVLPSMDLVSSLEAQFNKSEQYVIIVSVLYISQRCLSGQYNYILGHLRYCPGETRPKNILVL